MDFCITGKKPGVSGDEAEKELPVGSDAGALPLFMTFRSKGSGAGKCFRGGPHFCDQSMGVEICLVQPRHFHQESVSSTIETCRKVKLFGHAPHFCCSRDMFTGICLRAPSYLLGIRNSSRPVSVIFRSSALLDTSQRPPTPSTITSQTVRASPWPHPFFSPAMGLRRPRWLSSPRVLGWLLFPSLVAFVPGALPRLPQLLPAPDSPRVGVAMHVDVPGRLLQGWKAKSKRGPAKYHLPTGGPNVTKTADLMELRVSYTVDTSNVLSNERQLLKLLRSDAVEQRRNASDALLTAPWSGRPQRQTLLKLLHAALDHDLIVRENVAHLLKRLCIEYRWEMDEWIAMLAQKINPESSQDIVSQIYVMKALGILGPYASSYSGYITRFFDHEEEPILGKVSSQGAQLGENHGIFHGQLSMAPK
eukprot:s2132_g17.t1